MSGRPNLHGDPRCDGFGLRLDDAGRGVRPAWYPPDEIGEVTERRRTKHDGPMAAPGA